MALQVSLSVVILVSAGVLGKSVALLLGRAPGIAADQVLTTVVQRPIGEWITNKDPMRRFGLLLMSQLDALPGVRSSAIGLNLPTDDVLHGWMRPADGLSSASDTSIVTFQVATSSYFSTLGIPVLRGRPSDERDRASVPPTLILSRTVARRLFGEMDAVGKRVFARSFDEDPGNVDSLYEVIGVVGDVRRPGPGTEAIPEVYIPFERFPVPHMTVLLRASSNPARLVPSVEREIASIGDGNPVQVTTLDNILAQSAARPEFYFFVLAAFATLALLLTAIGTYSVTSFASRQRTKEIGVRMALGASRGAVIRLVLRANLRALAVGLVVGIAAGAAATRLLVGLLSGVSPNDPLVFLLVVLLVICTVLVASLWPAYAAATVHPTSALRS